MLFSTSPGVAFSEIDQSTSVPAVSNTVGAYVGNFRWGPVEERTLVDSETSLARIFGTPSRATSADFHVAAQFLKYTKNLQVVRAISSGARTANAGGSAALTIKNKDAYDVATFVFGTHGLWVARYPGALGNSLKVSLFGVKTNDGTTLTNFGSWDYASRFDGPPSTSAHADAIGSSYDEIHVAVIDEDGLFTGVPGTILETYQYLSQASDARAADGSTLYFKDVINQKSKYVYFGSHDTTNMPNSGAVLLSGRNFSINPVSSIIDASLSAGVDSTALGAGELATGYALFADKDTVDVSLFIGNTWPAGAGITVANNIISIVQARMDAVAFISPETSMLTASEIATFFASVSATSYHHQDSGVIKVYDKYNDQFIMIPHSSTSAGIWAESWALNGPWVSAAGERRGKSRGVTKLMFNPTKAERDLLYKASINSVVTFPGQGTMLYGDKTALGRPSALGYMNVRGLFLYLEKGITRAARDLLFELNTEFTRANFVGMVEPFLRTVKGRGGIYEYRVKCDTSNNTPDVIDQNGFVGDIYISPARSINAIQLNFIATRTGVEFKEIAG